MSILVTNISSFVFFSVIGMVKLELRFKKPIGRGSRKRTTMNIYLSKENEDEEHK